MGINCSLWRRKEPFRILLLGLDAAGKTTILYRMKLGEVVTTIPTIGFNVETVVHKKVSFTAWDVGGRSKSRPLIRHYLEGTDAVIYVVDSNDRERFLEAREEIKGFLDEGELYEVPFLVMANKQDLPAAASVEEITEALHLHQIRHRTWHIVPTVACKGEGFEEGFEWLTRELTGKSSKTETEGIQGADKFDSFMHKSWLYVRSMFVSQ